MPEGVGPLAGRRVLVVEDEYLIAIELKRWLQEAGAEVVGPVPDVEQALDLIEDEGAPDVAVLDINLGAGEMVHPVADRLAALSVPFLFATGDVRSRNDLGYEERPRLEKPIMAAELVRSLSELIGALLSNAAPPS
jgi:CheY-like chemotaxis protein